MCYNKINLFNSFKLNIFSKILKCVFAVFFKVCNSKKEGDKINIFSTKSINLISFIISTIIVLIFSIVIHNIETNSGKESDKINFETVISEKNNEVENIERNVVQQDIVKLDWYIEIPAISLKAPVHDTVDMEVLNNYVGHFNETSKKNGNIGLAGHNRGYKNNYFENINKLQIGDEIKYKYNEFEGRYYIEKIETIKSTNWSYLESSKNNKITLITCVENKPDLRLCIQAIQK